VAGRITTALTGERESLKQLGIVVQETEVQQRAMANTGKTVATSLTQQEKATATLELITAKAGKAVGDLARTQESAANQAKRIRAEFQTIAEDFASRMLPALAQMLPALQALIPPLSKLVDLSGKFVGGLALMLPGAQAAADLAGLRTAEFGSLSGLGDRALPGMRSRFNLEVQQRALRLGELRGRGWSDQDTLNEITRLEQEIRLYGELIAAVNSRLTAAASSATAIAAASAAQAGAVLGGGGEEFFGIPSVRGGRLPRSGARNLIAPSFVDVETAATGAAQSMANLSGAMTIGIASFGAMAQAVIRGSASMEQAMISAIVQIGQAIIQMQAASLGSAAGPLGAIVGAVGGLLGGLFGGGGREPQPVVIRDVSDTAADKLERRRTGPDRFTLVIVDKYGNVQQSWEQYARHRQRDAIPPIPGMAA